jgi:hypothetical protein
MAVLVILNGDRYIVFTAHIYFGLRKLFALRNFIHPLVGNMGSCNSKRMARRVADPANHEELYSVPPPPAPRLEIDFDVDNSGAVNVVQKNMKWDETHNHWTNHITDNHRPVNDPEVVKVIKLCGI